MFKRFNLSPDGDGQSSSVGGGTSGASNVQSESTVGGAIPAGYRIVKDDDWSAAQKWREQVSGMSRREQALKKHGLDWSAFDDEDAMALLAKSRSSKEFTPKTLLTQLFTESDQPQPNGKPGTFSQAEIERLVEEKAKSLLDKELSVRDRKTMHEGEYRTRLDAEKAALRETMESLGISEQPDEKDLRGQLLRMALLGFQASSYKDTFGDDHTLKGQYVPLDPQFIRGEFASRFKAMIESLGAAEQIEMAKRAASGIKNTAAGKSSGQPEPGDKKNNPTPTGFREHLKKSATDFIEKQERSRSGVVSAAG